MKRTGLNLLFLIGLLFITIHSNAQRKKRLYTYDVESKLDSLNIKLPEISKPVANYVHAVRSGNLIFLSGKGPRNENGDLIKGKLGEDIKVEEAYNYARNVGVLQLAVMKNEIGDLNNVVRIVKVLGMVNSTSTFEKHPEVINGFSDLMVEVFGERGKHARAAVGMSSLPRNMVCEIEMIVEVKDK